MTCEDFRKMMVDSLKQNDETPMPKPLAAHLAACPNCRQEMTDLRQSWNMLEELPEEIPSPALRQLFNEQFDGELSRMRHLSSASGASRKGKGFSFLRMLRWQPAWQFATILLLLFIGYVGGSLSQKPAETEFRKLSLEAEEMRRELSLVRLDASSAGDRLQGVRSCAQLSEPGDEIITRLMTILQSDSNIHVRLAAVDALYLFGDRPGVRQGVTQALTRQQSPLMQVALIDLLVAWREKRAVDHLKILAEDGHLDSGVSKRAKEGLEKLL